MAKRRTFTAAFEARVAKETLRGNRTVCQRTEEQGGGLSSNVARVRRDVWGYLFSVSRPERYLWTTLESSV